MKITDLNPDDRPREKLIEKGPDCLSSAELMAIVMGNGLGGLNAVDLARELIKKANGNLSSLYSMSFEKIQRVKGIGQAKAARIKAALELGRRVFIEKSSVKRVSLLTSSETYKIMQPLMRGLTHEECWVLFINKYGYLIGKEKVSIGGSSATIVDTDMVVEKALEKEASALILVHNHPSGNPCPGKEDVAVTISLRQALEHCNVKIYDHIVVCDESYFSFADNSIKTANDK